MLPLNLKAACSYVRDGTHGGEAGVMDYRETAVSQEVGKTVQKGGGKDGGIQNNRFVRVI